MMALLQPSEYNISYFDGRKATLRHNAGYSKYERWNRNNEDINSQGEFWADKAKKIFDTFSLLGKKVLELGCAKGFIVEDLRGFGAYAHGLDVSSYAIGEATSIVAPYLMLGDARTSLSGYVNGEFDFLFSLRFLECIGDTDLPSLITEMNRISKMQYHVIDEFNVNEKSYTGQFYNTKSLEDWLKYGLATGSKLSSQENGRKILTK